MVRCPADTTLSHAFGSLHARTAACLPATHRARQFLLLHAFHTASHTVLVLLEHGYTVVLADNLSNSFPTVFEHMKRLAGDKADKMKYVKVRQLWVDMHWPQSGCCLVCMLWQAHGMTGGCGVRQIMGKAKRSVVGPMESGTWAQVQFGCTAFCGCLVPAQFAHCGRMSNSWFVRRQRSRTD